MPAYLLWKKTGTLRAWKLMTNYKRDEVILVKFPYSDMVRYKKRPALVVQDESVETGLSQRVVVQITSNLDRTGYTRVLVRKIMSPLPHYPRIAGINWPFVSFAAYPPPRA